MRCPYCTTEIAQEAIVCPQCTRDLYLWKPLLEKIERLEQRHAEQAATVAAAYENRIAALEAALAALPNGANAGEAALAAPPAAAPHDTAARPPTRARGYLASVLLTLLPALALLVGAHVLLLFVLDVRPLYLRIASILIPVPFGFALLVWHPKRLWISALTGFAMAVLAVMLMGLVTARIDHVPVLPQDAREAREYLEYAASIGFAFLTGLLLGKWRYRMWQLAPRPDRLTILFAQLFARDAEGELGIERMAKRIQRLNAAFTPVAAASASIYTGVKALLAGSL